jgi:hypothetical protein
MVIVFISIFIFTIYPGMIIDDETNEESADQHAIDDSTTGGVDPNAGRFVRYQFTPAFLRLKHVSD